MHRRRNDTDRCRALCSVLWHIIFAEEQNTQKSLNMYQTLGTFTPVLRAFLYTLTLSSRSNGLMGMNLSFSQLLPQKKTKRREKKNLMAMATVSDRGWASDICIHASPYGQTAPTIFKGHTVSNSQEARLHGNTNACEQCQNTRLELAVGFKICQNKKFFYDFELFN